VVAPVRTVVDPVWIGNPSRRRWFASVDAMLAPSSREILAMHKRRPAYYLARSNRFHFDLIELICIASQSELAHSRRQGRHHPVGVRPKARNEWSP
jgi:hypothetical protein